jgi:amino acid adenylation domain-containing protein/non-ribosomal peptide synthase protein (TIGR01720 family)
MSTTPINQLSKSSDPVWLERYEDENMKLDLSWGSPLNSQAVKNEDSLGYVDFTFSSRTFTAFRKLAHTHGFSIYSGIMTLYAMVLYRYTGEKNFLINYECSTSYHEIQPIPCTVESGQSFIEAWEQIENHARENPRYAAKSFMERTAEWIRETRLNSYAIGHSAIYESRKLCTFTPYDLALNIVVGDNDLSLRLIYSKTALRSASIRSLSRHLSRMATNVLRQPFSPIASIEMLSTLEKRRILIDFNATNTLLPVQQSIHELFEEQVKLAAEHPAIVHEGGQISYRELDEQANRWANFLASEKQAGRETRIGLLMENGSEHIIASLAVLKSGGAFVPIHVGLPQDRITDIIESSGIETLLSCQKHALMCEQQAAVTDLKSCVYIDTGKQMIRTGKGLELVTISWENISSKKPEHVGKLEDLAYIIFTSGTTGKPKGVMIEHRGLVNLATMYASEFPLDVPKRVVQFANVSFDASIWEWLQALTSGGTLCIPPRDIIYNFIRFERYLNDYEVNTATLPPAYAASLHPERIHTLRHLFVVGSASTPALLEQWGEQVQYINGYGPTESSICATYWKKPKELAAGKLKAVPIGKPIANFQLYIIDPDQNPQPIGVTGELCIGGIGLTRGYLNLPEVTREKLVPHPFQSGEWIYKTGDLAKWLPDGNVEYIGRIDHQVKVRGIRIETEEIETVLLQHPAVKNAAVLDKNNEEGQKYLAAYLVLESKITTSELQQYVLSKLPDYMLPQQFIQVDTSFPLNASGKIDRKRLLLITTAINDNNLYIAPSRPLESELTLLWQQVLGTDRIGVEDDFLLLGGHSLKAAVIISAILEHYEIRITLADLLRLKNIRSLASFIEQSDKTISTSMDKVAEQASYPASSAQQRMYTLSQAHPESTPYNLPMAIEIHGELDLSRLEMALNELIRCHESLRTSFILEEDGLRQNVHEQAVLSLMIGDSQQSAEETIQAFIAPFDLHQAPLFRALWKELGPSRGLLLMDIHHSVCDGISTGLLLRQLNAIYNGEWVTTPARIQYKDCSNWLEIQQCTEDGRRAEQYWLKLFEGELPILQLPTDQSGSPYSQTAGDHLILPLTRKLADKVKEAAGRSGTTPYMVMLGAFQLLLSRYSGQEDMIVGTVNNGRSHSEMSSVVGMFVNTLPLRLRQYGTQTGRELLEAVKQQVLAASEHSLYPFEKLVGQLEFSRSHAQNPLFDILFSMENLELPDLRLGNAQGIPYPFQDPVSRFKLALIVTEQGKELSLKWEYLTSAFKPETVERMNEHYLQLLEQLVTRLDDSISEFEMITIPEREQLLNIFNTESVAFPEEITAYEWFMCQSGKTPEQTAVICGTERLTYRELNEQSNRLARALISKGLGKDSIAAVMSRPSVHMITAILAILKSGAAYLPIDPDYPAERISYMLHNSGAEILLTQSQFPAPDDYAIEMLDIDHLEWCLDYGAEDLESLSGPDDLAYIIYTSGSTGKPKGVMIEHRSLVQLCHWHHRAFALNEQDRTTQFAGFGFDAAVWEIFPSLLCGAELHLVQENLRKDADRLNEYMNLNGITVSFLPTPICEPFMSLQNQSLRLLLTGGDTLKSFIPQRYKLVNNYGPTEHTVVATSFQVEESSGKIPIGKPIDNTSIYIIDKYFRLQPVGVEGEIAIAGTGIARGYLHNEMLTNQKFVDDPFHAGRKMYLTGDRGRWLTDGNIEYKGRVDDQIKVRGYRIELGEIESKLLLNPEIRKAVVISKTGHNGGNELYGYCIPAHPGVVGESIREQLREQLPEYMVPAQLVLLESFPLTPNGKIDKKQLAQRLTEKAPNMIKLPPTNTMERILVEVWKDVLGETAGTEDHFYSLGGDSIKAIQVASRLHKYGLQLDVKHILQQNTIRRIAPFVKTKSVRGRDKVKLESAVLTPIQNWLFQNPEGVRHHFNQSVLLFHQEGFSPEGVERSFDLLSSVHEGLRTKFRRTTEGQFEFEAIIQDSIIEGGFSVNVYDMREEEHPEQRMSEEADTLQAGLNIEHGPLVKLGLFRRTEGDYLLIAIHHLIVDGVSWRILLEDFRNIYTQLITAEHDTKIQLPESTDSFFYWAEQMKQYTQSEELLKELAFWNRITSWEEEPLYPGLTSTHLVNQSSSVTLLFTREQTEALLKDTHHSYNTEINDLLLCAVSLAVKDWIGRRAIKITIESHGREELFVDTDVTRTVGWFTSVYPLLLELIDPDDIGDSIRRTKETLRAVPHNGIGYGVLKYLSTEHRQGLSETSPPVISFNFMGQMDNENELFSVSNLYRGQEVHPEFNHNHAIALEGVISGGCLEMVCHYNRETLEPAAIHAFAEAYRRSLLAIIEHCQNRREGELTPSDCSSGQIDFELLGEIFESIGN